MSASGRPVYLLSFLDSASEEVVQYILKQLQGQGLQSELISEQTNRYAAVSAGIEVLAKQVGDVTKYWSGNIKFWSGTDNFTSLTNSSLSP